MINIVKAAKLDKNNIVIQIMDIAYQDCIDENCKFSKNIAIEFCKSIDDGDWVISPLFPSHPQREAAVGGCYLRNKDLFISPKPYKNWYLDSDYLWKPPTKKTKIAILGD